ncbi:MAG TPA: DUF4234 domain-containing protein [Candidatus Deferrimicrobium sp.]|nr:DUF4234 domain-containing protein [Candidatus Deferrimicrobium sp.]
MADNAAHDPAGPQSDPVEEPAAVLAGAPAAPTAQGGGATAVMDPAANEGSGGNIPVWSFPDNPVPSAFAAPSSAAADRHQVELPFPGTAEVVGSAPAGRSQPLLGPVGSPRSPVLVALLAAVTLGVYALVWHQRVNRELEEFDPKLHSRPARSTMAVAVPWLLGLLVSIAGAALIVGGRLSIQLPFATHVTTAQAYSLLGGLLAVPYLTLLVPFSVVAVVMTLERLRSAEEHVGITTDRQVRPVGTSLLLALPVIGGLLLIGVVQRRVNALWESVAPTGRIYN